MTFPPRRGGGSGGLLGGGKLPRPRLRRALSLLFACGALLLGTLSILLFPFEKNDPRVPAESSDLMAQIQRQREEITTLKSTAKDNEKERKDLLQKLQKKEILRQDREKQHGEEKKNVVAGTNRVDARSGTGSDENKLSVIKNDTEEPPLDPAVVTFVLVATMNPNAGPRSVALLASMQRFLAPGTVHTLLVVVPQQELRWWELAAAGLGSPRPFSVRVLSEDAVLASGAAFLKRQAPKAAAREANGMGYRVQMLLKLGVAHHVPTAFYVTFDCDVVLARPLARGVLVTEDGRGLLQGGMGPAARRWIGSSTDAFFGRTVGSARHGDTQEHGCTVDRLARTVGVTPAVLSKRAAVATLERLERAAAAVVRPGMHWDEYLMNTLETGLDWTEYGLYAAGTCLSGLLEEVHVLDPSLRLYDAGLQEDGSRWSDPGALRRAFASGGNTGHGRRKNLFVVLQSIGGSTPVQAMTALYPHLKPVATAAQ
eukprot:CAMPEP_0194273958 /NCGR_PEP_ID=MMETSP0169-20130528/7177_1 /TAXON_ID=218684 /ORGANISM="Corethron pennatum, Strain L29A3" /LENGTH=483 /DNA_ID=CAMNT_0039017051 /DNA_START=113 /DNA_END=1564 /DNA_ORIENTATION=-